MAVTAVLIVSALSVLVGLVSSPAAAEPPTRLPDPVSDQANVLNAGQRLAVEKALDRLYDDHGVQLWVVYVKTFDGLGAQQWADATVDLSALSERDILLAVATEDREYRLTTPPNAPTDGLRADDLASVGTDDVVPALKDKDWAAAGLNAAAGLGDALDPSYTGFIVAGTVGGLAVVGGGGAWAYTRYRRRSRIADGVEALRDEELSADQLADQPLDVLDPWSREVLTDTDNAIRTSEEELALAVGEFGETLTAPFRQALTAAREAVTASFALRQRLDDDIPETPDEQRSLLVQIITTCTDADTALDQQVAAFDTMRNLLINAPARFDEITRSLVDLRTRADAAGARLPELIGIYGEQTLTSILSNVTLAREQIEFAERSADQGRAAISRPVGEQGAAVADIRAAEGSIAAATTLLDAIDNVEANIAAARAGLPALIAEVRDELREAAGRTADGGAGLAAAAQAAANALQSAESRLDADPLGTFTALLDADADLDSELAAARGVAAERTRRTEVRTATLTAAQAKVSAATDFISTRRGAVAALARTRLSEAQRLLDVATQLAVSEDDPAGAPDASGLTAIDAARRAGTLADGALGAAQDDVAQWQASQRPGRESGSAAGAILGGILVDSFLRGSMRGGLPGGFGGGYSHGGRSPGSFGGSSSSGRIGVGGRF
ncbi:MAG: TPM domain-containing protein [Gordonia sp. (in: high G+C Gram-positive bacteria)]